MKLVSADYDDIKTWEYLDRVGIIHTGVQQQLNTGKASTKSPLRVEFIHMGLLLGATDALILSRSSRTHWSPQAMSRI